MGNCAKLKWNRKRLGLTQKQFAEKVGVHVGTIQKLETDETAWGTIQQSTEDKISAFYDSMTSWQPKRADKVVREIKDELENESEVVKEEIVIPEPVKVIEPVHNDNGLTENDNKTLILIEFAFEGLKESKTHEDFVANINMMKRIIKQY